MCQGLLNNNEDRLAYALTRFGDAGQVFPLAQNDLKTAVIRIPGRNVVLVFILVVGQALAPATRMKEQEPPSREEEDKTVERT